MARRVQAIARGLGHYDNIQTCTIQVIRRLAIDEAMREFGRVSRGEPQGS